MKDFFEIETKQINDRRLQALIKDEGMAGVGTYFYLRCIIAGQSSDGVPVSYVIKTANVRISRIRIRKVLYNYGLFTQDEFGIVRAANSNPRTLCARTERPRTSVWAHTGRARTGRSRRRHTRTGRTRRRHTRTGRTRRRHTRTGRTRTVECARTDYPHTQRTQTGYNNSLKKILIKKIKREKIKRECGHKSVFSESNGLRDGRTLPSAQEQANTTRFWNFYK